MTNQKSSGLSPGKLILIGVLSVVFIGVLVVQFGGSSAKPVRKRPARSEAAAPGAPTDPAAAVTMASSATDAAPETRRSWPTFAASVVSQFNPFDVPPIYRPPDPPAQTAAAENSPQPDDSAEKVSNLAKLQAAQSLQQQRVSLVMVTPDGPMATIGERRLYVGDVVDGWRVSRIDSHGVVFVEAADSN